MGGLGGFRPRCASEWRFLRGKVGWFRHRCVFFVFEVGIVLGCFALKVLVHVVGSELE